MSEHKPTSEKSDKPGSEPGKAPAAKAKGTTGRGAPKKSAAAKPKPKGERRGVTGAIFLALLALLAAAGSAGGGWYLWQQFQRQGAELGQRVDALGEQVDTLADVTATQREQGQRLQALESRLGRRDEAVNERLDELSTRLESLRGRLGQDREDWKLAEIGYLLKTANTRLQLAADLEGARAALTIADRRLRGLADPRFGPVRAAVAEALQALRAVPEVDIEGLSMRLGALIGAAGELPLPAAGNAPAPGTDEGEAATGAAQAESWRELADSIWSDLKGLVRVRRTDAGPAQLTRPDDSALLRRNLQLQLQGARLALLERQPQLYRQLLDEAGRWAQDYFDADSPAVQGFSSELTALQETVIAPDLPSLDGPLRALREVGAGSGAEKGQ